MSPMAIGGRDRYSFELALDRYVCYPMESVTLTIRVRLETPMRTILCVHLPQNLDVENFHIDGIDDNQLIVYTHEFDGKLVAIPLAKYLEPGGTTQFHILVRLHTIPMNHMMTFTAWMSQDVPEFEGRFFSEPKGSRSIELAVKANADYLRYLPEVYGYDDFVNRFLMMFESFWKPINQQIAQGENYYDPYLTPDVFLKWLGTWVGMEIDETFPKERIRDLIKNAIPFYHSRGTAESLRFFLEMYSGGKVEIKERKAHNMQIGGVMGLGDGLALGVDNKPNTVYVSMQVPASELTRTGFTKDKYAKKIKSFIREIVPAHTVFSLSCEYV
ncbi:MAG: hypothetical protein IJI41_10925 [Anaerolineaceae bacterium]|nr:hypothetical protein [Anaerolineaceae bacterium]